MNESINKFIRHPATAPTFVGAVCFGIGYLIGKRNRIIGVVNPTPKFFNSIGKIDKLTMDPDFGLKIEGHLDQGQSDSIFVDKDVEIRVARPVENPLQLEEDLPVETAVLEDGDGLAIFTKPETVWEWETEIAGRTKLEPYILHKDEFYGDENEDYTQTTLIYYAGDDILVDQDSAPVYNHIHIVGPLRFGHGSDDPTVFYVRNDKLKAEYEIQYDEGLYSVEVLGLEIEHNDRIRDSRDELKHTRAFKED